MPQVDQVRHKPKVNPLVAVGVAVAVVALVIVLIIALKPKAPDTKTATTAALNNAADKAFSGDQDGAIAALRAQLTRATTNEEKGELYMGIGSNYEAKEDYKAALEAYQSASELIAGYGVNEAIARTAMEVKNNSLAIEYLRKNRELIVSRKAFQHDGDLPLIEKQIVELGGKL